MTALDQARQALAPTGTLRAALNLSNTILVQGTAEAPRGVTVDLSHELAARLKVPLQLVPFPTPLQVHEEMRDGAGLDIVFLAAEPARAEVIDFTAPYVLIEGIYAVRAESPLRDASEVDRPGLRIAVTRGAAYDLFLTRSLKSATLVRGASGFDLFRAGEGDALAGVRQLVAAEIAPLAGARILNGRFMDVRQAMGTAKGRSPAALAYLQAFIAEMKRSGFVAEALRRSGQDPAAAAPPD